MQPSPGASVDFQSAAADLLGKLKQARTDLERTASPQQQQHAAPDGQLPGPHVDGSSFSPDSTR
jgi:hypothetical protein